MRVLLVDDAPVVRRVVATALRAHPVDLVEAESVSEALALLGAGTRVDAAVLDLELLDGDGVQIAEALAPASAASSPRTRVAFFSGTEDEPLRVRAAAHGPVFRKPADLAALVSWLVSGEG